LSRTKISEEVAIGSALARISGGGVISGQNLHYTLVGGTGSNDNADFAIVGDELRAARRLDHESGASRHLRIRWDWTDALDSASILASGERAMTVVLANVTTDDDDSDGQTEGQEAIAGTDPSDAASFFRSSDFNRAPNGVVSVTVAGVAGRTYFLQSSDDLVNWQTEGGDSATMAVTTPGAITLATPANSPAGSRCFYRVAVVLSP
jgi:hypothetical protein